MIGEDQRTQILDNTRHMLQEFGRALASVTVNEPLAASTLGGYRAEGNGDGCDDSFRLHLFMNAPHSDDDLIFAEKHTW